MKRLDEIKVLRDPIHGYIHIDYQIIWDCLNAPEFQRLRRIHQLGATFQVYHTAEHSRFSHSLGVYEIVRRMINEIKEIKIALNEHEKITVLLAGLLHDIGHGPFSHSFEHISRFSHEEYTVNLITKDSKIFEILFSENEYLPQEVASVINHTHPNKLLSQMVSSQLDADRMDYLLRDSYFTGTSYGNFDLERVLRSIRIEDNKLVIKESGIHTIEDYIMARYHMYWQVYYHPTSRSFEALLAKIFKRYLYLVDNEPEVVAEIKVFNAFKEDCQLSNKEFHALDEMTCYYGFTQMTHCQDTILSDLADRILNRRLFKYDSISTDEQIGEYYHWIKNAGYNPDYYMYVDETEQTPYVPYTDKNEKAIWILTNEGSVKELSRVSNIVAAILLGESKNEKRVFFPRELND